MTEEKRIDQLADEIVEMFRKSIIISKVVFNNNAIWRKRIIRCAISHQTLVNRTLDTINNRAILRNLKERL